MSTGQSPSEPPSSFDPKIVEVLDFDVLEEHWNDYELEDNSKLRGRVIVTRVARRPGMPTGQYDLSFQTVFIITAPLEGRGSPGPPLSPEEIVVTPEDISAGRKL